MNDKSECTGLSAQWCPVCGDCVCDRENGLDDPKCPLHAVSSGHAKMKEKSREELIDKVAAGIANRVSTYFGWYNTYDAGLRTWESLNQSVASGVGIFLSRSEIEISQLRELAEGVLTDLGLLS